MRVPSFIQSRVCEWWVHGEDIRSSVGLMSRREHAPIHCVNDLSIRTIPYALQLEDAHLPGKVVADRPARGWARARGARPGAARDAPRKDKAPDAYIEGRGHAFALVAAHRADLDQLLYDGDLLLGGDIEVGTDGPARTSATSPEASAGDTSSLGHTGRGSARTGTCTRGRPSACRTSPTPSSIASRIISATRTIPGASTAVRVVERGVVQRTRVLEPERDRAGHQLAARPR